MLKVSFLAVIVWACRVAIVVGQDDTVISIPEKLHITIKVLIEQNLLHVTMQGNTTGYVAFGISPQSSDGLNAMIDADIIVAGVGTDGLGYIHDYKGPSGTAGPPSLDAVNNVNLVSSSESNGVTTVEFTRNLVSPDETDDIDIKTGPINIIWAMGTDDAETSVTYHTERGKVTRTLWDDESNATTSESTSSSDQTTTSEVLTDSTTQSTPIENSTESSTVPAICAPSIIVIPNKLRMEFIVEIDQNLLRVKMEGNTTGYVAFGISPQSSDGLNAMIDADIIVAGVGTDGLGYIHDYKGPSGTAGPPSLDAVNNVNLVSSSESNGVTTVEFTRNLVSSDKTDDLEISSGPLNIIWAMGTDDAETSVTYHTDRGKVTLTLWQDDGECSTTTPIPATTEGSGTGSGSRISVWNVPILCILVFFVSKSSLIL